MLSIYSRYIRRQTTAMDDEMIPPELEKAYMAVMTRHRRLSQLLYILLKLFRVLKGIRLQHAIPFICIMLLVIPTASVSSHLYRTIELWEKEYFHHLCTPEMRGFTVHIYPCHVVGWLFCCTFQHILQPPRFSDIQYLNISHISLQCTIWISATQTIDKNLFSDFP